MSVPATADDVIKLIRKSGLLDEPRFSAFLSRHQKDGLLAGDARKLVSALVRDGLLTYFQAEQFLLGKWRGFTLGKFKLLERIGVGGMGQVFLCEHMFMRKRMAVKVLPPTKAEDPVALGRFYREARVASGLDHSNIVHTYDIDQDGPLHFLVMEYIDGATLLDIVKKFGPLSVPRACHYVRQACLGLEYAHQRGMIHRDIKPGNVILDRQGTARLLDMGLARFYRDEQDQLTLKYDDKNVLGTADYVAPEQTRDSRNIDIRADIYGMGASFYFLLTGQPPFPEPTVAEKLIAHQTKKPRPIRELRPEIPGGVAKIIEKMMAKAPGDRYQSPKEIVEALESWTAAPIELPPAEWMPKLSPAAADTQFAGTPVLTPSASVRDASHVRPDEVIRSRSTSNPMLQLPDMSEAQFEAAATVPVPPPTKLSGAPIPTGSGSVVDLVSPLGSWPAASLPKPPDKSPSVETRPLVTSQPTPPLARLAPPETPRPPSREQPKPAAPPPPPRLPPELARLTRSKIPGLGSSRPPSAEIPLPKSLSELRLPPVDAPKPADSGRPPTLARPSVSDPHRPSAPGRLTVAPPTLEPARPIEPPRLTPEGGKPGGPNPAQPPVYKPPTLMPFFNQPVMGTQQPTFLARVLRWLLMIVVSSLIGAALGIGIWYFALLKR